MENVIILSSEELSKEKQLLGEMEKIDTDTTTVLVDEKKLNEADTISSPSPDIILHDEVAETVSHEAERVAEIEQKESTECDDNGNEDTSKDLSEVDYSLMPPLESFTMVSNLNEVLVTDENNNLIKSDIKDGKVPVESEPHTDIVDDKPVLAEESNEEDEFVTPRSTLEEHSEAIEIVDKDVQMTEAVVISEEPVVEKHEIHEEVVHISQVEEKEHVSEGKRQVEDKTTHDEAEGSQQIEAKDHDDEICKTNSSFDIVDENEIEEITSEETATTNEEPAEVTTEESTKEDALYTEHLGDLFKYKQVPTPHDDQCWSTASTCSNDTIQQQKLFAENYSSDAVTETEEKVGTDIDNESEAVSEVNETVETSKENVELSEEKNVTPEIGEQLDTPAGGETADKEEETVEPENDGWVKVLGNDSLKRKIKSPGVGGESLVKGQQVTMKYSLMLSSGEVVDEDVEQTFQLGDGEVIAAIDLTANLATVGEVYEVLSESRLAYGALGRPPKIGGNCSVLLIVEIIHAEDTPKVEELNETDRITIGDRKRKIGNDYFARFDYAGASKNYKGACQYLDPPSYKVVGEPSDEIKDLQAKSWCNLAISELKQDKIDGGITAVNRALQIDPKSTKALYRKGKLLEQKGELDQAEKAVKLALKIDPKSQGCKQYLKELTHKIANQKKRQQRMYKKMFNLEDETGADATVSTDKDTSWLEGAIPMVAGAVTVGALAVAAYSAIKSFNG